MNGITPAYKLQQAKNRENEAYIAYVQAVESGYRVPEARDSLLGAMLDYEDALRERDHKRGR